MSENVDITLNSDGYSYEEGGKRILITFNMFEPNEDYDVIIAFNYGIYARSLDNGKTWEHAIEEETE